MPVEWIYLSPHFDDIALSCGGLVWEQVQAGHRVSIWTICGGLPPKRALSAFAISLHQRWETGVEAVRVRQEEDIAACKVLGAAYRHYPIPDCIYRPENPRIPHYYASEESLWGKLHPNEAKNAVRRLSQLFARDIPAQAQVVCPLALGKHVDHLLTRKAAERLHRPLWYYPDYPYVLKSRAELEKLEAQGWMPSSFAITAAGLEAWQAAIAAYTSQVSTFWRSLEDMRLAISAYAQGRVILWQQPAQPASLC